jgi:signal transduction histidine kinase
MCYLPEVELDDCSWQLPLTGRSASVLAATLLADAGAIPPELAAAMAMDPGLCLWTLCRAAKSGSSELTSVSEAAQWLFANRNAAVQWQQRAVDARPPAGKLARYAELAVAGVQAAELAESIAEANGAVQVEQVYLLGLLHAASDWLALAASPHPLESSGSVDANAWRLLPAWLAADLASLPTEVSVHASPAADCVRQALRILEGSEKPPTGVKFNRRANARRAAELRQSWLVPASGDWLPSLAERLSRLHILETKYAETLEAEKLEAMAEFAAGAGHEINNPLAIISGRAQLFLREERDPQRRRELAVLNTQANRVYEMIADMMLFARPPQPRLVAADLATLLQGMIDELAPKAAERGIQLCLTGDRKPLFVQADPAQLQVALRAMCDNSLQAMQSEGRLELSLSRTADQQLPAQFPAERSERPSQDYAKITVCDTGPGIPEDVRRHLFDPFFSGRGAGRGLGLGLSKCWRIVTNHGGKILVDSAVGGPTTFTILLPLDAQADDGAGTCAEAPALEVSSPPA